MRILTDRDPEALAVLRHSTAHVMAQAVLHLWPDAKIAIGPAIADGFYYDFDFPEPIAADDLERIEAEMRRILGHEVPFVREDGVSKARARRARSEPSTSRTSSSSSRGCPTARSASTATTTSRICAAARTCRRPRRSRHSSCSRRPARTGAATRRKPMLTRIYGTAFFKQADLDEHLRMLEEARRRDHRRIGRELDLFHTSDVAPGAPFWHPRGMVIFNELTDLWRELNLDRGYREVRTPIIYSVDVWRRSGHWDKYRDNMFFTQKDERPLGVKPMNCPGHIEVYQAAKRSYRDLPMRLAEQGIVHRDEPSGALHGLLRVIHITQDDAHIFCTRGPDRGRGDRAACGWRGTSTTSSACRCGWSSRPGRTTGSATTPCGTGPRRRCGRARARGREYELNEGDGAFYGPKIDLHMTDSVGRSWQMGTVQLDYQMPERFEMVYTGDDNAEHRPVMVHRALFGAFERFIGILIEHYAGAFPLWLSPVQAIVLPVAERHDAYAEQVAADLRGAGLRAEPDLRTESVGKKIAEAEHQRIPCILVVGDKEVDAGTVSLRRRDQGNLGARPLAEVRDELSAEAASRTSRRQVPGTGESVPGATIAVRRAA